jgi:hypothetical protein
MLPTATIVNSDDLDLATTEERQGSPWGGMEVTGAVAEAEAGRLCRLGWEEGVLDGGVAKRFEGGSTSRSETSSVSAQVEPP